MSSGSPQVIAVVAGMPSPPAGPGTAGTVPNFPLTPDQAGADPAGAAAAITLSSLGGIPAASKGAPSGVGTLASDGMQPTSEMRPATAVSPGAMSAAEHVAASVGVLATGTIQCPATPSDAQTEIITVNDSTTVVFVWKTTPTTGLHVQIAAGNAQQNAVNLAAVINANTASCYKTAGTPVAGLLTLTETRYGERGNYALQGTAASTRVGMLGGRNPLSVSQGPRLIQKLCVVNAMASYAFPIDMSQFAELELVGNGLTQGIFVELLADGVTGQSLCNYVINVTETWIKNAAHSYICLTGVAGTSELANSVVCRLRSLSNGKWRFDSSQYGEAAAQNMVSTGFGTLPQGVASLTLSAVLGNLWAGGIWALRGL
jgi:hypothetical protein